jgi:serine/threonine protein kinase
MLDNYFESPNQIGVSESLFLMETLTIKRKGKEEMVQLQNTTLPLEWQVYTWNSHAETLHVTNAVGEGTYGVVFVANATCAMYVGGGTPLLCATPLRAVKWLRHSQDEHDGVHPYTLREMATLTRLQHPNIITLTGIYEHPTHGYVLAFEYMEQDLRAWMAGRVPSRAEVQRIIRLALKGVESMHGEGFMHRDIKPANIMVDADATTVKLCDMGLARQVGDPGLTPGVVTQNYRAPEVVLGDVTYTTAIDMWSLGCVLAELIKGRPMFQGASEVEYMLELFEQLGTPVDVGSVLRCPLWCEKYPQCPGWDLGLVYGRLGSDAVDLLRSLLCFDPGGRPTAARALQHPFLTAV